jgi:hypothetical protein
VGGKPLNKGQYFTVPMRCPLTTRQLLYSRTSPLRTPWHWDCEILFFIESVQCLFGNKIYPKLYEKESAENLVPTFVLLANSQMPVVY